MYLKSLVLKGFKSFADRSALTLEPGITAIVGPNGSGKSNISDAVLWVLGERNAKNLRGQAMEDVIFAGSSARKGAALAEVDLVLDNSCGTLPVDYSEVVITRRMHRSGESEYLINGTVARRLDVLDILHDSGLGSGTHSIISQGNLDSVLASKPEDRRALVEEAAGVLKHKQRKAKSERKLANMDQHLARVRDVVSEVERQLGPLERKAKRARTFGELSGQLAEAKLALSVDDLRRLQEKWEAQEKLEETCASQVEEARAAARAAEEAMEKLQATIAQENLSTGSLSAQFRAVSLAFERLESAGRSAAERQRAAQQRVEEIELLISQHAGQRQALEADLAAARETLSAGQRDVAQANETVATLEKERKAISAQRQEKEELQRKAASSMREAETNLASVRRKLSQTREALSAGVAHIKVVEGRRADRELACVSATADAQALSQEATSLEKERIQMAADEQRTREELGLALQRRDACRKETENLREALLDCDAKIRALEEIERATQLAAGEAAGWVAEHAAALPGAPAPLPRAVSAPPHLEGFV
ncbi:chromosome segregation SMC family protein, partial [Parvibacter caecicola]|uniref:chromosome segregation SMC family protein n=1 Tax=Parvibacter caecicola TaxID=747645 RepID=UPI0023F3F194